MASGSVESGSVDIVTRGRGELNSRLQSSGIELLGEVTPEFARILTPEALEFVALLVREFALRRGTLLARRVERQARIDGGEMPDFLVETKEVRSGDWTVSPLPNDL